MSRHFASSPAVRRQIHRHAPIEKCLLGLTDLREVRAVAS